MRRRSVVAVRVALALALLGAGYAPTAAQEALPAAPPAITGDTLIDLVVPAEFVPRASPRTSPPSRVVLLLVGEIHQAAGGGDKDGVTGGAMPGVVTGPGTYPAAAIVTVLRGGYAVRTPVNMVVTRSAGTTTPTAGPATVRGGTEVTLGPGDSILYPLGVSSLAERSTGPEALEAVAVVLRRPGSEWWTPFAVTGATGRVLLRTALEAVPAGPLAVRLRRLTLAPGAGVPVTPPGTGQWVAAVTGAVATGADGVVRNPGAAPIAVYVLTVAPVP